MGEQLINLHPPAENLAFGVCWTRPWRNGTTVAGWVGTGDWKKGAGCCMEGQIKDQSNLEYGGLPGDHMQSSYLSKGEQIIYCILNPLKAFNLS